MAGSPWPSTATTDRSRRCSRVRAKARSMIDRFEDVVKAGLIAGLLLLAGCGTTGKVCDSKCNGCCDPNGVCQNGGLNSACGAGGHACAACAPQQFCSGGFC